MGPAQVGNSWRTTQDVRGSWPAIMDNLDGMVGLGRYAGPGAWNDADLLEARCPGLACVLEHWSQTRRALGLDLHTMQGVGAHKHWYFAAHHCEVVLQGDTQVGACPFGASIWRFACHAGSATDQPQKGFCAPPTVVEVLCSVVAAVSHRLPQLLRPLASSCDVWADRYHRSMVLHGFAVQVCT